MNITNEIFGNAIGEIIGAVVIVFCLLMYKRYRAFIKDYSRKKQELEEMRRELFGLGATKQEFERLQEALKQADAQLITELLRQLESTQAELGRKNELLIQAEVQKAERQQNLEHEKTQKRLRPMSDEVFEKFCWSGETKIVEEAIINGANVNARHLCGRTALMSATMNRHKEVVELLLQNGADVDAKDKYGNTALMYAANYFCTETVPLLISYGAR